MDIYVRVEKKHGRANYSGGNYVKPRITEMSLSSDQGPDLLEYGDERNQKYCEEAVRGNVDGIAEEEFEEMDADDVPSALVAKPLDIDDEQVQSDSETSQEAAEEDSEESEVEVEEEEDGSVIVSSDELKDDVDEEDDGQELKDPEDIDAPDTGVEVDLESEDEESDGEVGSSLSSGDLIFGSEAGEEREDRDNDEQDGNGETESMTIDGVEYEKQEDGFWVSEDGEDFVFPPGKDESDYDLEEYGDGVSQGQDGNREQSGGEGQASLNQV